MFILTINKFQFTDYIKKNKNKNKNAAIQKKFSQGNNFGFRLWPQPSKFLSTQNDFFLIINTYISRSCNRGIQLRFEMNSTLFKNLY